MGWVYPEIVGTIVELSRNVRAMEKMQMLLETTLRVEKAGRVILWLLLSSLCSVSETSFSLWLKPAGSLLIGLSGKRAALWYGADQGDGQEWMLRQTDPGLIQLVNKLQSTNYELHFQKAIKFEEILNLITNVGFSVTWFFTISLSSFK